MSETLRHSIIVIGCIYQIGFLVTFLWIMLAIPSKELSKPGFRGHLIYFFRLIIWPYGMYYYTSRYFAKSLQNTSNS